ncbi:unnamed protein product [Arabidopsis arenosa]|uniref:Uncharacterized protein n=1 Tax=Arabidopsis arenosa TaxID=38785 RepID=A0A8S1ZN45_ARAAE|nr:unnamed protein product [Arabidopsis arenosa]
MFHSRSFDFFENSLPIIPEQKRVIESGSVSSIAEHKRTNLSVLEGGVRVWPLIADMDKFLENKGLCDCPGQCSRKDLVLVPQGATKFGDQGNQHNMHRKKVVDDINGILILSLGDKMAKIS